MKADIENKVELILTSRMKNKQRVNALTNLFDMQSEALTDCKYYTTLLEGTIKELKEGNKKLKKGLSGILEFSNVHALYHTYKDNEAACRMAMAINNIKATTYNLLNSEQNDERSVATEDK